MTNAQMAHKMGLDKLNLKVPRSEYKNAIMYAGLKVIGEDVDILGVSCFEGELEMNRGTLHIYCGDNGAARIDKPNGTHKWVYEKTPAQIMALLKQIIEFNK